MERERERERERKEENLRQLFEPRDHGKESNDFFSNETHRKSNFPKIATLFLELNF